MYFLCLKCRELFPREEMVLEHIIAIELQSYTCLEEYYNLMFDVSNVEPWCKGCAKAKNKVDNALIKEKRK